MGIRFRVYKESKRGNVSILSGHIELFRDSAMIEIFPAGCVKCLL